MGGIFIQIAGSWGRYFVEKLYDVIREDDSYL